MSADSIKIIQNQLVELNARQLYEKTGGFFQTRQVGQWAHLTTTDKELFKTLSTFDAHDLSTTVAAQPEPAVTTPPDKKGLHHPMVVWETGILIVCSIIISYLIR